MNVSSTPSVRSTSTGGKQFLDPEISTSPESYGPTPSYSQSSPAFLPRLISHRTLPRPRDVYRLRDGRIGWLPSIGYSETPETHPDELAIRLIGEPQEWHIVDEWVFEQELEQGTIVPLAEDVPSPKECWWAIGADPPQGLTSPTSLSFKRITSRTLANQFLNHPVIDHQLGGVRKSTAIFAAITNYGCYAPQIIALVVVGRPGRMIDDGQRAVIRRYATHPCRPPNTGSWVLSRVREWAIAEGYRSLRTLSGVSNDNEGTLYQASNFTHVKTVQRKAGGDQRPGRKDTGDWKKRVYTMELDSRAEHGRVTASVRTLPSPTERYPLSIPSQYDDPEPGDDLSLSPFIDTTATAPDTIQGALNKSKLPKFVSPDDVGLVRLDRTPKLAHSVTDSLQNSSSVSDGLSTPLLTADAIFGIHRGGHLHVAFSLHQRDSLSALEDYEDESTDKDGWVVTSHASSDGADWTNVEAWLLSVARKWTPYTSSSGISVANGVDTLEPARKRAGVPVVDPPTHQ